MGMFLVTGATGFLGSLLVEELLKTDHTVIGVGRKNRGFLSQDSLKDKRFVRLQADISRQDCRRLLKTYPVTGIFHLASQQPTSEDVCYGDFYRGNAETTLNVLKFAETNKIKFIIFSSTITFLERRGAEKTINEASSEHPQNYYGLTKYLSERMLEIGLGMKKTKVIIVRFPSIFGKNHLGGIVYTYFRSAKKNKHIEVYGGGKSYRNLIYGKDAAQLLKKIAENIAKFKKFDTFVCGGRDSSSISGIAHMIKGYLNSSSKIVLTNRTRPEARDIFITNRKIKKFVDFKPLSVQQGLARYCEDMNENV